MVAPKIVRNSSGENENLTLFETVANDLLTKGYSINPNALPFTLTENLLLHMHSLPSGYFAQAGIGRANGHMLNNFVRTDELCWISDETETEREWLQWISALQSYLNNRLFLGLFSFESHFAHYGPGDFYKRHLDAFKGVTSRVLSLVVYLNAGWTAEDEGELVIYTNPQDKTGVKVTPGFGTFVTFLSEEFPHEVLPAKRDRYSIAGWFRVNTSSTARVDPPL